MNESEREIHRIIDIYSASWLQHYYRMTLLVRYCISISQTVLILPLYLMCFWYFDILKTCWLWRDRAPRVNQFLKTANNPPLGSAFHMRTDQPATYTPIRSTISRLSHSGPLSSCPNPHLPRARYQTTRDRPQVPEHCWSFSDHQS